jgi:Tfp pilus tip-associated adhesin PilY1
MFMDKFPAINDPATPVNLDTTDTTKITDVTDSSVTACAGSLGWRMTLTGRGEQVVTSSLIAGGRTFFNTSRALAATPGTCAADLGEAKGYNVNLLCAVDRFSVVYQGGGLPISPVQGTTTLAGGEVVTFVIGGPPDPGTTTPFTPGKVKAVISPKRTRTYWYRQGDK